MGSQHSRISHGWSSPKVTCFTVGSPASNKASAHTDSSPATPELTPPDPPILTNPGSISETCAKADW